MNRTRSTAGARRLLAVAVAFAVASIIAGRGRAASAQTIGPPPPPAVGSITGISDPMTRQVVQRRDDNLGNILVVGTYSGNADNFQASSSLQPGMNGIPQPWTPLINLTVFDGFFVGIFRQPAGGFYNIQVRPLYLGEAGASVTVQGVGVGEVFITAGQSNSTNWGLPTGLTPNFLVSCFDPGKGKGLDPSFPGASWRWGYDPQPALDESTAGSAWPTMASNLVGALGVPVGLYSCGYTGTLIEQWLPGRVYMPATANSPQVVLFDHLTNAIEYLNGRGGARAVLWVQGESDYGYQTDPATYEANLLTVIQQSRAVTGVPIKWMVAQATTCLTTNLSERVGIERAQAAVVDHVLTFPGPNTDSLGLAFRYNSSIGPLHFNAIGLELLGGYWGCYVVNIPGFLSAGALSSY